MKLASTEVGSEALSLTDATTDLILRGPIVPGGQAEDIRKA